VVRFVAFQRIRGLVWCATLSSRRVPTVFVNFRSRFLAVSPSRMCSRTACTREAVATLTYVYSDSTAVLGPLAVAAEPHSYDLCREHAARLTAPRGWEVVRVSPQFEADELVGSDADLAPESAAFISDDMAEQERRKADISKPLTLPDDDWAALADAVREDVVTPVPAVATPTVAEPLIAPEAIVRPRHAAESERVQDSEIARRGHLRVLRGEG